MTTKYSKVVTYREEFPPINSNNPLKIWSREVRYQITYGHQTSQGSGILEGGPNHKFA